MQICRARAAFSPSAVIPDSVVCMYVRKKERKVMRVRIVNDHSHGHVTRQSEKSTNIKCCQLIKHSPETRMPYTLCPRSLSSHCTLHARTHTLTHAHTHARTPSSTRAAAETPWWSRSKNTPATFAKQSKAKQIKAKQASSNPHHRPPPARRPTTKQKHRLLLPPLPPSPPTPPTTTPSTSLSHPSHGHVR